VQLLRCLSTAAHDVLHSYRRLFLVYGAQARLLLCLLQLQPRQRWLCKLQRLVAGSPSPQYLIEAAFCPRTTSAVVYAWLLLTTSKMYVGSTFDFKQRMYAHVRCIRGTSRQNVHRAVRAVGPQQFFPVPLLCVPHTVLRDTERLCVQWLLPALNVEWMPHAVPTSMRSLATKQPQHDRKYRPVARLRKRADGASAVVVGKGFCWIAIEQTDVALPSLLLALTHLHASRQHLATLQLSVGLCLPNDITQLTACSSCWEVIGTDYGFG
jgi:hypothetical protein